MKDDSPATRPPPPAVFARPGDVEQPCFGKLLFPLEPQLPMAVVGHPTHTGMRRELTDQMIGEPVAYLGSEGRFLRVVPKFHLIAFRSTTVSLVPHSAGRPHLRPTRTSGRDAPVRRDHMPLGD